LPATRGWAASPDFLMELVSHARAAGPLTVLECSSGVSTLVLARCLQLNGGGKVFSLEHDAAYAEQTRRQLRRHGLGAWAVVLDAPLQQHALGGDTWPWYAIDGLAQALGNQMDTAMEIDMLVIDGPPQAVRALARYPAGPLLFPRLRIGAAVFLDDAARLGEQAILARWKAEFPMFHQTSRPCEKGCAVLTRHGPSAQAGAAQTLRVAPKRTAALQQGGEALPQTGAALPQGRTARKAGKRQRTPRSP
jgi:predicted O-methyltransferase YrrM